jgi:hypothetical protein
MGEIVGFDRLATCSGDEQFLMFNIGNPHAMRDNVRQSTPPPKMRPARGERTPHARLT